MGFKIAWELPPKVTSTWHKPFFLYKVCDSYLRKETQKTNKKNWGGLLSDKKGQYYTHLISYSGYSVALKGRSLYFVLLSPCQRRRAVPEKKNTSILVTLKRTP